MACNLAPQCNVLYQFFQCQLLEDNIDEEIMVRTMKGIHTFKKDCNNQISSCSTGSLQVHPFPSLVKEDGNIFRGKKKYYRPFLSYPYLP